MQTDPGKITFETQFDGDTVVGISFQRGEEGWELYAVIQDENMAIGRPLDQLSVVQKAALAKNLPSFMEQYIAEKRRRYAMVIEANDALEKVNQMMEGE